MRLSSFEKIMLWVIRIGLWTIPFLPLYVSSSLLFPFITGKNFTFRIATEILFACWLGLMAARAEYRPRLTPLFKAVTIFICIVFLADLFGPNPYRSFFSNYERMEGFMMIGHLYLYFVMLVSVFRKKDWLVMAHTTLAASAFVSFIGLLQHLGYRVSLQGGFRVDSTIGNPTYLAAYLLFHLWLLLILALRLWDKKWLRAVYGVLFLFEAIILYFTATRGAVLAFLAVLVAVLCYVVYAWHRVVPHAAERKGSSKWPVARIAAASVLGLIVVVPFTLFVLRSSFLGSGNNELLRLTNYSLQERTIQSRFKIWNMSLHGALERPILGWGQEDYYLVFQKYYDPGLYDQEPWFDRSHNIVFDWLVHTGFVGLISFFAIFVIMLKGILRAMRNKTLGMGEGVLLCAVFVTYILQDLFVFDNLNTYLLLFGFLAYSAYAISDGEDVHAGGQKNNLQRTRGPVVACVALAVVGVCMYPLHIKPIQQSRALIGALQTVQLQLPEPQILGAFQNALSYDSFGNTEVREQLGNIARDFLNRTNYPADQRAQFASFAIQELEKQIDTPAKDVKHMIFLASILDRAGESNPTYYKEAESILQQAIQLAPRKQMLYFELAQDYLIQNRPQDALGVLQKTVALEPEYPQAVVDTMIVAQIAKRPDVIAAMKPLVVYSSLRENELQQVAAVYQQSGDLDGARGAFAQLVLINPQSPQYHATYAALSAHFGDFPTARQEAQKAGELDPKNFGAEAQQFLQMLQGK